MNAITIKTEFLVKNINYDKINFGKLISMALAQVNQYEPKLDSKGNIVSTVSLKECADFLGYEAQSDRYLKDSIDRLIKTGMKENLLTLIETKEETERHFLITGFKTSVKKDTVEIFFNKDLTEKIFVRSLDDKKVINRYIIYDITMFRDCANADIMALYELFKLYSYKKEKFNQSYVTTVADLKKHLDITHTKVKAGKGKQKMKSESYKDYKEFKHSILSPAIKFINKYTDITVKILSEARQKSVYTLNGIEKSFTDVTDISFLIENKINSKYSNVAYEIAMESGNDLESIKETISKNTIVLNNAGIEIDEKQVAVLLKLCNDISLVKLVLWEASRIDDVKDIGAFAYSRIKKAKEDNTLKVLKTGLKYSYSKTVKPTKKEKVDYKLDKIDSKDAALVELYNLYRSSTGHITAKDVDMIKRAMTEFYNFQIKNAINYAVTTKSKEGKKINSFKYIETCLQRRMFGDRVSYDATPEIKANKIIEINNSSYEDDNDESYDFSKLPRRM